ncbi:Coenzyme F420 hydrogenase/dehydrogenase, beta subunit C-terminal domain [Eubacterium sp.]|uniref:Coenzyme F420 hydrogenase/dehydrogenase, beta subunit C-terminal domain n=1 Tax=Eubacterium sp. TaxID=142586 RepID=UPI0025C2012A|nr:Coenzyme F420 hydrogenase/dehydrogenase, beta subunit C-terminal domain [Eubacterium sp.]MCI7801518.1 Coenzyme F420 hydrogenase/dehydrogenase, beta subunit C-terminal domain [Eubacterium sp.]
MIDKVGEKNCCICGNCVRRCPKEAISLTKNFNTFNYPEINYNLCNGCNRCETVCPTLNELNQQQCLGAYMAKNINLTERKLSSSGGMFSVFANYIIENNGLVCGAAFDGLKVKHIIVDNKADLYKLRGSKYVQSDLGDCFEQIEKYLDNNRLVLFVGCPCQTAALRIYLKKDYSNQLYLVDFICHGMLSQSLFDDYIKYLERKYKSRVVSFSFRDKTDGWIESGPKVKFENGKIKRWPLYEDTYMQGYFSAVCMKNSCYTCKYKNFHSGSDVTFADYWGCEILDPEFYDFYGVSAVVINNENGNLLFNNISNNIEYKAVDLENIVKYNSGLIKPFEEGKDRSLFMDKIKNGSTYIEALLDTADKSNIILQLYREIKRKIRILKDKY